MKSRDTPPPQDRPPQTQAMKSIELTDASIRRALADQNQGRLTLLHPTEPGLTLRVGKLATWSLQVRLADGRRPRMTLGEWPELSVTAAVEAARQRRMFTTQPPRAEVETVAALLEQYGLYKAPQLKRRRETMNSLRAILDPIKYEDPLTLTRLKVGQLINRKALTAPSHANRQLAYVRALFNWGIAQGLVTHNPAATLPKPAAEPARERVLTIRELAQIWTALDARPHPYSLIVRLLMLTALRLEEVARMRVSELSLPDGSNEGCWTIPGSRTKTRCDIRVPLSPQAREVVETAVACACGDIVFSRDGQNFFSGWSKAKGGLDRAMLADGIHLAPWVHHDFRRSFVTAAADELDIRSDVADACLNHKQSATRSQVARVYNRSHLFAQRRSALMKWADHILSEVKRLDDEAWAESSIIPKFAPTAGRERQNFLYTNEPIRFSFPVTGPGADRSSTEAEKRSASETVPAAVGLDPKLKTIAERLAELEARVAAGTTSEPQTSVPAEVTADTPARPKTALDPFADTPTPLEADAAPVIERNLGEGTIERRRSGGVWEIAYRLPYRPRHSAEDLVKLWCEESAVPRTTEDMANLAPLSLHQVKEWLYRFHEPHGVALASELDPEEEFRLAVAWG